MRPPLNAGENKYTRGLQDAQMGRFNEAPAERGGKLVGRGRAAEALLASMRPPLNAGENAPGR